MFVVFLVLPPVSVAAALAAAVVGAVPAAVAAWREASRREEPFDLIVADLEIRGGAGGMEVMARLREEFPGLRAVLTTGYTEDAALAEHAARGYSAVLAKPFSMESLLEAVASVLG